MKGQFKTVLCWVIDTIRYLSTISRDDTEYDQTSSRLKNISCLVMTYWRIGAWYVLYYWTTLFNNRELIATVSPNCITCPFIADTSSCLSDPNFRSSILSSPYTLHWYRIISRCGGHGPAYPISPFSLIPCTAAMGSVTIPWRGMPAGTTVTEGRFQMIHGEYEQQDLLKELKTITATDAAFRPFNKRRGEMFSPSQVCVGGN